MSHHIRTVTITALAAAASIVAPAAAIAGDVPVVDCETVDYQGAPLEMCPEQAPDPTNCYTGDYQGAPIEVCMPTGWAPDPTWTYQGQPIVMHVSKDYVPLVTTAPDAPAEAATSAPAIAPPAPVVAEPAVVEVAPSDLVSIVAAAIAGVPLVVG